MTPTIAVLGTGTMGAPMARNLAKAGFGVRAWNRHRAKADPLAADGVTVTDSPAEAAAGADVLLTMLFDAESVLAVVPDALQALPPGAIWVQMSTVGVDGTRRLAALAAAHEVAFVDAPVLGTKTPAEQGTLVVLASGEPTVLARCAAIFEAVSQRTVVVPGDAGATKLKLVINNWVVTLMEGIAESVALAEGAGLDPQVFLDTIKGGAMDTPYARIKGAAIIERNFAPSFSLAGAHKDAGLVLDLADEVGVEMGVTAAVREHMALAVDMGHGDEDMAATYFAHRPHSTAASAEPKD